MHLYMNILLSLYTFKNIHPSLFLFIVPTHFDTRFVGARSETNNAGELSAIVHALCEIQSSPQDHTAFIHSDSHWAIQVAQGKWQASAHQELVRNVRRILQKLRESTTVIFVKTPAHDGDFLERIHRPRR